MAGDPSPAAPSPAHPGKRVAHYEILEELGRGGMGVVYRARDVKLGRCVALKSPWPTASADSLQRRRFLREARAAARLSHPNIVPIFEVLEEEGVPWLAMDLVEGASLRALLGPGRPLPVPEILRHAEGLASALQAAHGHGILHSDVNPNNVLVTADGRAILTDFGLAQFVRLTEESSTRTRDRNLNERGQVAGTPRYMSPEQALGKPLDARSDIFSLGAVLYEMCTGGPAFRGSGGEVVDAVLNREPTPISRLNYEVPEKLERIVRKSLAKRPDDRYQDVRDLLADLRTLRREVELGDLAKPAPVPGWRSLPLMVLGALLLTALVVVLVKIREPAPRPAPVEMRLAVLPHQDASRKPEALAWPELIQAMFVRELTGVEEFGVLDPLTLNGLLESSLGTHRPARTRGLYDALRSLGVAFVVDGTVTATRTGYRLQSNLVAVPSGEVQFADDSQVAGEDDLAAGVATLSNRILSFLQLNVLRIAQDKDLRPWLSRRPKNVEALKAFVQGTEYAFRYEPGAGRYLLRAVELEPTFVSARVWLISALVMTHQLDQAREHYRQLQQLETPSPFEHALIDWAGAYISQDHAAQARHLEVALRYSPDNYVLLVTLAEARFRMDDFSGAVAALGPALSTRWRYPHLYTLQGACLIGLARHRDAGEALKASLAISPVDPDVYGMLSALASREGNEGEAERHRELYVARSRQVGAPDGAIFEGLAAHLLRVGLYDQSSGPLREAMGAEVQEPGYHDFLSSALYKSGIIEKASVHYRARLRRDPAWADGHLLLGRIEESGGEAAEAAGHYEAFLSLDPAGAAARGVRHRLAILRGKRAEEPRGAPAR